MNSTYAYSGTYSLLLDDSVNDTIYSYAAAILAIDLSGQTQVELDFWWREFADENDPDDGVFISDDNGVHWYSLLSFNDGPEFWRHQVIDLDEAVTAHRLALNDHFQIKFQFFDGSPIPTDGYAIDEVRVRAPQVPVPAEFPYYTGFESGALGLEWTTDFTFEGRVEVVPPIRTQAHMACSWMILETTRSLRLRRLAWRSIWAGRHRLNWIFGGGSLPTKTMPRMASSLAMTTGRTGTRCSPSTMGPNSGDIKSLIWMKLRRSQGLVFNDHFQIKFQFYDDYSIPSDGYAFDEVQVRTPQIPVPAGFPYHASFESGGLGTEWTTRFTYEGRIAVSSTNAYSGTYSLLLDDSRNDTTCSFAAAILAVDLSGQTQVELDFWWREFADENHSEDGVFISDDNGLHWWLLFSFNNGPESWQHQVIDLDESVAAHGLTLNDHFQIKFQFYDDYSIPSDGYAIDEVQVRPNAAPTLAWTGGTNYEQDGLHPENGEVSDDYVYRIKYADVERRCAGVCAHAHSARRRRYCG